MTVSYMKDVATATSFTFLRLLFRWRGSVWKAIYWELLMWLFVYVNIRTIHEFIIVDTIMEPTFRDIVKRCSSVINDSRTVITFALGFYVSFVTNRWWNVFMAIPWPDTAALQLTAFLRTRGASFQAEDKSLRQSIMRYLILSYVLVFRDVSLRIKKRFPTYDHLTPTLMTEEERIKLEKSTDSRHWVPIEWSLSLLKTAERRGCIDKFHMAEVTRTILSYRQQLHDILSYDWISVPLVYVQAVNICTVSYFLILCFSVQVTEVKPDATAIPIYAIIEFVVFTGWLKTAFVMLNPFGLDDDDFEMDTLIERNLMISLCYITDFYDKPPKLVDMNVKLPHTLESAAILKKANPMFGSAVVVEVPEYQQRLLNDKQTNMVYKMMSPQPSMTALQKTGLPVDEVAVEQKWNFDNDELDKQPKGPVSSIRESVGNAGGYILKKEDLEAAVAKLLEKKTPDVEEEKVCSDKTQSETLIEDLTQRTSKTIKKKHAKVNDMDQLAKELKEKLTNLTENPSRPSSKTRRSRIVANSSRTTMKLDKKMSKDRVSVVSRNPSRASSERRVPSNESTSKKSTRKTPALVPSVVSSVINNNQSLVEKKTPKSPHNTPKQPSERPQMKTPSTNKNATPLDSTQPVSSTQGTPKTGRMSVRRAPSKSNLDVKK